MPNTALSTAILMALLILGAPLTHVDAHDGATGIVKERMESMKSVSERMKAIAAMMKGDIGYDADRVAVLASEIASHGGDALTAKFPEHSVHGPSEALPAIWDDWEAFAKLANAQERTADRLREAALSDPNTRPVAAFKALAKPCKSCHDDFRQKK